jgi:hypothetical protein
MKVLFGLTTIMMLVLGLSVPALAQKGKPLCDACQRFGRGCCALRATTAACVSCAMHFGYGEGDATRWCNRYWSECH